VDLLLALFLSAANSTPPVRAEARAEARIRILNPHKASQETWDPGAMRNQKEIVRVEKDGSQIRLRLTEFE
jgi:hypothetical protein